MTSVCIQLGDSLTPSLERRAALAELAEQLSAVGFDVSLQPDPVQRDDSHRDASWIEVLVLVVSSGVVTGAGMVVNGALSEAGKDLYGIGRRWLQRRHVESKPDEDAPGVPQELQIRDENGVVLARYKISAHGEEEAPGSAS